MMNAHIEEAKSSRKVPPKRRLLPRLVARIVAALFVAWLVLYFFPVAREARAFARTCPELRERVGYPLLVVSYDESSSRHGEDGEAEYRALAIGTHGAENLKLRMAYARGSWKVTEANFCSESLETAGEPRRNR